MFKIQSGILAKVRRKNSFIYRFKIDTGSFNGRVNFLFNGSLTQLTHISNSFQFYQIFQFSKFASILKNGRNYKTKYVSATTRPTTK